MIKMIAAVGRNGELGVRGGLCWRLSGDMRFFRETTMGATVVMGARTWESLPGALPGRKNMVICREKMDLPEGVEQIYDLDKFVKKVASAGVCSETGVRNDESAEVFSEKKEGSAGYSSENRGIFVIGGGSIYGQMLPVAEEIYLTEIEAECPEADTFFPSFDKNNYSKEILGSGEENGIKYSFAKYVKIK